MRLASLRALDQAVVYKKGARTGVLRREGQGITFAYDSDYDGPPVASTLPRDGVVRAGPPGAVPPFFAGLLPEGRRLVALRRAIKTSADDEFSLLIAVGRDPIGDVQVLPPGESPDLPSSPEAADAPSEVRFADLFARVVGPHPADVVGLPGVQDKVSGRMIALPLTWRDTPCILKLEPPEFPGLVENEAFFYRAAAVSGLSVADVEVIRDATGSAGLLVRRFDRTPRPGGGWGLLGQEEGCQALGRWPADKYRVSSEAVVGALAALAGAPLVAARALLRQLAFAYVTCNGDVHAKNLAVVEAVDGEWVASPAYDLPSTHPYGDTTMALPIGGRDREDIGRAGFFALGEAVGLPNRAIARLLDDLLERVPAWLDDLDTLPYDSRRIHKLRRAIGYRCERLRG